MAARVFEGRKSFSVLLFPSGARYSAHGQGFCICRRRGVHAIRSAARDAGVIVSLGLSEKSRFGTATLYNSNLLIDRTGDVLNHYWKLMHIFWEIALGSRWRQWSQSLSNALWQESYLWRKHQSTGSVMHSSSNVVLVKRVNFHVWMNVYIYNRVQPRCLFTNIYKGCTRTSNM